MKTVNTLLTAGMMLMSASALYAQNMSVNCGNVSYLYDAANAGLISFDNAQSITVNGHLFAIDNIGNINMTNESVENNTVCVTFNGTSARVLVAGNIAEYVTAELDGAHVTLTQSDLVDDNVGEISYILKGESTDGGFVLNANFKASLELQGLTLTNPSGAAIDIESGKRTAVRVKEGTVNTLTDGAAGSQKAALYCKGHLEFKQKGTLNVVGNKSHAIAAKEYIEVKNTVINVTKAVKDGLNCNQYFKMESGKITISGTGDDGIQVAFKDDVDREAEDTGTFTILGGTLTIDVTADAAKAIKADGDFVATGGEITATVSGGGLWDSAKVKTKAAACIGADGNLNISGGTFNLTATGGGGKGISVDGTLTINGGTFNITTTGGLLAYVNGVINNNYTGNADNIKSDYKSSPKGIKADGAVVINGGDFFIWTKGAGGEGLESKDTITINDGNIVIRAYEDGTNSTHDTIINGGNLTVTTGTGDAIDSNGNIFVNGGVLRVIGAGGSEQGFDAGDGCKIYITGGTMMAAGGGNSAPSDSSKSTQAYVTLNMAITPGQTVTVKSGDTVLIEMEVPAKYSSAAANVINRGPGGGGGGNWGWGGSSGNALLLSCPEMENGKSYTITCGTTTSTATAKLTGGSSGPGGGM